MSELKYSKAVKAPVDITEKVLKQDASSHVELIESKSILGKLNINKTYLEKFAKNDILWNVVEESMIIARDHAIANGRKNPDILKKYAVIHDDANTMFLKDITRAASWLALKKPKNNVTRVNELVDSIKELIGEDKDKVSKLEDIRSRIERGVTSSIGIRL